MNHNFTPLASSPETPTPQIPAPLIPVAKRTAIVDILRGWAIIGVVIGNYEYFAEAGNKVEHADDTISLILQYFIGYVLASKSWTMLSVLFGYGFAVVMDNVAAKGKNAVLFFCGRMWWLLVLAFINSAFWFGDILKDYAILGFILLLFYKRPAKFALIVAAILMLLVPFVAAYIFSLKLYNGDVANTHFMPLYYSSNWIDIFVMNLKGTFYRQILNPGYAINVHMVMLACMLLGFAAQQIDFFNRLLEFKKQLKLVFYITFVFSVLSNVSVFLINKADPDFFAWFKPYFWISSSTMICILTGICWLYLNGKLQRFFASLQVMGKMTLTNYMMQSILAAFLFLNVGLGIFNTKPYWFYILIALLVFVIQIGFSKWWLKRYQFGPVEWIWRQLSYGKRFPIRRTAG
jgi:uncharacterized protein